LTPICTKSFIGWGFIPDPTGSLQRYWESLHPTSTGREMEKRGGKRKGGKRKGDERKGKEGRGGEGR